MSFTLNGDIPAKDKPARPGCRACDGSGDWAVCDAEGDPRYYLSCDDCGGSGFADDTEDGEE